MRGGERRAVGDQLRVNRCADQFGERDQLGKAAALRDGIARHDDRALGGREHLCGGLDRLTIAAHTGRDARRSAKLDVGLELEDVARQREEHRTGRRRERGLAGAMHHQREILQPVDLVRPLHQRPRDRRKVGVEDRLGAVEILIVLAGRHEDRRARLLRVVEHAHRVAEAGCDVQVHDRELAGGLRVAVGHRHHDGFLQAEHIANVVLDREGVHQRQFGGARIAEQHLDAFLLQDLKERALSGNDGQDFLRFFVLLAMRLLAQQVFVFAGEYEFARLIVDGRRHHHNAGGALRDERRDGERRIERVAHIDPFEKL